MTETKQPASPGAWMKMMMFVVFGAMVITSLMAISVLVGAFALRNATGSVRNATDLLNRRSIVLETTDCSVRAQANFLDTVGKLIQLDRNNVAERDRLFAALTSSSAEMRACAPTKREAQKVSQVTQFVQEKLTTQGAP